MTTQLDTTTIENLRNLNSQTKSKYFAGSRITQDISKRKWYEKMSNIRSGFMLDLQEVTQIDALQPSDEMQQAQTSLEEIREKLPQNNKEEKEMMLQQELIKQEEEVEKAYQELKKNVGTENHQLHDVLNLHKDKIHGYIEKLKSF